MGASQSSTNFFVNVPVWLALHKKMWFFNIPQIKPFSTTLGLWYYFPLVIYVQCQPTLLTSEVRPKKEVEWECKNSFYNVLATVIWYCALHGRYLECALRKTANHDLESVCIGLINGCCETKTLDSAYL